MAQAQVASRTSWWGGFQLEVGELGRWRIGSLDLWVRRMSQDWRYGAARSEDYLEDRLEIQVPAPESTGDLPPELARFGCTRTDATIELVPALADRPVVARPAVPFSVPPGQKVELFVSTPLWVRLRMGDVDLVEVPCSRPSDTWFGSNTRGVLSYATRTHLRRSLDELPMRPQRAVSCLTVENRSASLLALERLSLPVPQLSLFGSPSGTLWTEHVAVTKEGDDDLAEVSLGKGPPSVAGGGRAVAEPRAPQGRSFGSLVFGGLFEAGY